MEYIQEAINTQIVRSRYRRCLYSITHSLCFFCPQRLWNQSIAVSLQCRKGQTLFEIYNRNHHHSAIADSRTCGHKTLEICQQRSNNVKVGVGAEYEHLEIRMQTADRWYIW
jgi:hypothetical protein